MSSSHDDPLSVDNLSIPDGIGLLKLLKNISIPELLRLSSHQDIEGLLQALLEQANVNWDQGYFLIDTSFISKNLPQIISSVISRLPKYLGKEKAIKQLLHLTGKASLADALAKLEKMPPIYCIFSLETLQQLANAEPLSREIPAVGAATLMGHGDAYHWIFETTQAEHAQYSASTKAFLNEIIKSPTFPAEIETAFRNSLTQTEPGTYHLNGLGVTHTTAAGILPHIFPAHNWTPEDINTIITDFSTAMHGIGSKFINLAIQGASLEEAGAATAEITGPYRSAIQELVQEELQSDNTTRGLISTYAGINDAPGSIEANIGGLYAAAGHTVTSVINEFLYQMADDNAWKEMQDVFARGDDAEIQSRIIYLVYELVRIVGPAPLSFRQIIAATQIGDASLEADAIIMALNIGPGRDPNLFPQPERITPYPESDSLRKKMVSAIRATWWLPNKREDGELTDSRECKGRTYSVMFIAHFIRMYFQNFEKPKLLNPKQASRYSVAPTRNRAAAEYRITAKSKNKLLI